MTPQNQIVDDQTTFIAPGCTIKGEMTFAGPVKISGRVEGIIHAEDLLEITQEGVVEGDVFGTFIDVQGTVKGNLTATKSCRLNASARLTGELRAANLAIAEGACFVGKVYVGGEESAEEQAAPEVHQPEPVRVAQPAMPVSHAAPAPMVQPMLQPAASRVETPVSVLQNRLEQMAVEAEQVAVAAQMGTAQQEPMVRVNNMAAQATLNRSPRIIKATTR